MGDLAFGKGFIRKCRLKLGNIRKSPDSAEILPDKGMHLPDFLGIGAQKCATTWVDKILRYHPSLFLPSNKSLHYFENNFGRGLKAYSDYFQDGADKIKGEITPAYCNLSLEKIAYIKKIMPNVRLFFLMRNPADRAWLHAVMDLSKKTNRKIEDIGESEFDTHFKSQLSRMRSDYLTIVDNWLSVFPKEQLYLGFFEDIVNKPKNSIKEILDHIGASEDLDWALVPNEDKVYDYQDQDPPIPENIRGLLNQIYREDIELLYGRFKNPVVEKWRCK